MNGLIKHTETTYALLRIVTGFLFLFHGLQKIFGVLTDRGAAVFGTQAWFGGLIELVGGILVMVGLQTRWAAFLASGTMAVAYFQFHFFPSLFVAQEGAMEKVFHLGTNIIPQINGGDKAVLYCFIFLYIAAKGGGKWSLDGGK
jgi:putative oxidoreductase